MQPAADDLELSNVLSMVAASEYPVPVIDAHGHYQGVIDKKSLLQTLDKTR